MRHLTFYISGICAHLNSLHVCKVASVVSDSRQEYWSGLPFPPPWDLPNLGIELTSPVAPALQGDSLPHEPSGKPLLWINQYTRFAEAFWTFKVNSRWPVRMGRKQDWCGISGKGKGCGAGESYLVKAPDFWMLLQFLTFRAYQNSYGDWIWPPTLRK